MNALGNRLLAALPPEALCQLWPGLERVELPFHKTLHSPDEPIHTIYFPESGYLSRLLTMADGSGAEISMIGSEGMAGMALLLGGDRDCFEVMTQVPGTALRMDVAAFREALDRVEGFRKILLRYLLAHFEEVARTGACNGRHHIDQRLARWLLMAHDRVKEDEFPITHEFLSMMLGVRRAGVSTAAGEFQKTGYIRYARGRIEILDRPGLESRACECYALGRPAYERTSRPLKQLC